MAVVVAAAAAVIVVVFQPRKWGRNYRRASVGFIFLLPVCLELRVYGRCPQFACIDCKPLNSAMAPRLKYSTAADSASDPGRRHRTYRLSATPPHLLPTEVLTNLVRPGKES
jgi:hypothetical protein